MFLYLNELGEKPIHFYTGLLLILGRNVILHAIVLSTFSNTQNEL